MTTLFSQLLLCKTDYAAILPKCLQKFFNLLRLLRTDGHLDGIKAQCGGSVNDLPLDSQKCLRDLRFGGAFSKPYCQPYTAFLADRTG